MSRPRSAQVLGEFCVVMTRRIQPPLAPAEAAALAQTHRPGGGAPAPTGSYTVAREAGASRGLPDTRQPRPAP